MPVGARGAEPAKRALRRSRFSICGGLVGPVVSSLPVPVQRQGRTHCLVYVDRIKAYAPIGIEH